MYRIPFHQETFTPKTIPGNVEADFPVTFELSMAGGPDHARLKSVLWATGGIAGWSDAAKAWSPEMQASVIAAFKDGPQLFANCVGEIHNLRAPAVLCRRVGIKTPTKAKDLDDVPITNGVDFARIVPFMPALGLELAFEIQRLTLHGAVDPRFSEPSSGSDEKSATPNGNAPAAPTTSSDGVTADAQA